MWSSAHFRLARGALVALCGLLLCLSLESRPRAQEQGSGPVEGESAKSRISQTETPKSTDSKRERTKVSPQRQAEIMRFVGQHHPQLKVLLLHLKRNMSREYLRALKDLDRSINRISQFRDAGRRELELRRWKAKSRAQLLGAQLQAGHRDKLELQLREALGQEYDLRMQILSQERDRVQARVTRLEDQLRKLEQERSNAIDRQFQTLTRRKKSSDRQTTRGKNKPQQTESKTGKTNSKSRS